MVILKTKSEVVNIIKTLDKLYPEKKPALIYKTTFELLIATVISAQCTDKRVNVITPFIFKKYKNVVGFSRAKQSVLEKEIRSAGFFRSKAKSIIGLSKKILKDFKGKLPNSMKELIELPGVARKTANIVLSHGFKKAEGIAVDTHVKRLSFKVGFTKNSDPNKIEKDLMEIIPKKHWLYFNSLLVYHGRNRCKARKPDCLNCEISKWCLFYDKTKN